MWFKRTKEVEEEVPHGTETRVECFVWCSSAMSESKVGGVWNRGKRRAAPLCLANHRRLRARRGQEEAGTSRLSMEAFTQASQHHMVHPNRIVEPKNRSLCTSANSKRPTHGKRGRLTEEAQESLSSHQEEESTSVASIATLGSFLGALEYHCVPTQTTRIAEGSHGAGHGVVFLCQVAHSSPRRRERK